MSLPRVLVIALVLAACRGEPQRQAPAEQAAPTQLSAGTQTELAQELADAEHRGSWSDVRKRWQGQRLRWRATRYAALCRAADSCNVAVFPIQRPAARGWMPRLGFAPGELEALIAACGTREPCDFTFEGTLVELDVSGERATKLRFGDVRLAPTKLAARALPN